MKIKFFLTKRVPSLRFDHRTRTFRCGPVGSVQCTPGPGCSGPLALSNPPWGIGPVWRILTVFRAKQNVNTYIYLSFSLSLSLSVENIICSINKKHKRNKFIPPTTTRPSIAPGVGPIGSAVLAWPQTLQHNYNNINNLAPPFTRRAQSSFK